MIDQTKSIEQYILTAVNRSKRKVTPIHLWLDVSQRFGITRKSFRKHLKTLLDRGSLAYIYEFGCTFLAPAIHLPFPITGRTIIVPTGVSPPETQHDIHIYMSHGSSFGSGDHPTTRICASGLERIQAKRTGGKGWNQILDVGTGSGILLILGLFLGVNRGVGTDLDSCALAEAKENIRLNGLEARAMVSDDGLETLRGPFDVVSANLRYPTLMNMRDQIARLTTDDAMVVLSGIREEERSGLKRGYTKAGFDCSWEETKLGWAGLLLEKQ